MAEIPHRKASCAWVALVGLLALGIATFVTLQWREFRGGPVTGPKPSPEPKKPAPTKTEPRLQRSWPIESLAELSFDEALTLLSSEIESYRKAAVDSKPIRSARIEKVAVRLGEMHEENLRKIARAAPYYESHSPEVRSRFAKFRATYEGRWQSLQRLLTGLRAGDADVGEEILTLLRDSGALKPPLPIPEAKDLPRRRLQAEPREPRLTHEEWQTPKKVGMAPRGVEQGIVDRLLGVQAAHAQGVEDDLAETPEVKFTAENAPEIQKLLDDESLRGSPAKIANWVRNHIEFVPIWGVLQSSVTCLENRKGTAMDIASLTIALLRASGIRARYQAGTVRLPIAEAKNWLGNFESAIAASSLLQSGGIPAAVQVDGNGQPVALRFEHVWVRAFVDYIPYQGVCHVKGDTWIDIDTAIKRYSYFKLPDLEAFFPWSSPDAFVEEFFRSAAVNSVTGSVSGVNLGLLEQAFLNLESASGDVADLILEQSGPMSLAEIMGLGRIMESNPLALGTTTSMEVLAEGWEKADLPEAVRFGVEIRLERAGETVLSVRLVASEVGGSRFSLHFAPESDIDRQIIADQIVPELAENRLPARLLVAGAQVVPELRRDGTAIARGRALPMGASLEIVVDYEEPVLTTAPIRKRITAGEMTALALDLVQVPRRLFERVQGEISKFQSWLEDDGDSQLPQSFQDAQLSLAGHLWFAQVDELNRSMGSALGCPTFRYPSAGFASVKWNSDTLFGLPLATASEGIALDIPGDVVLLVSRRADTSQMARVSQIQGLVGSGLEGFMLMQVYNQGVAQESHGYWLGSTTALVTAWKLGDALVKVSRENADVVLPSIETGAGEIDEIRSAVDQGLSVFTHTRVVPNGEKCLAGYIIIDELTGNGIYRMSGGLCGATELVNCVRKFNPEPSVLTPKVMDRFSEYSDFIYDGIVGALKQGGNSKIALWNAYFVLLKSIDTFFEKIRDEAKVNPGSSPGLLHRVRLLLLLSGYGTLNDAVRELAEKRCPFGGSDVKCASYLPSYDAGWAFEGILRSIRMEISDQANEMGWRVPCGCFCKSGDCSVTIWNTSVRQDSWCTE